MYEDLSLAWIFM